MPKPQVERQNEVFPPIAKLPAIPFSLLIIFFTTLLSIYQVKRGLVVYRPYIPDEISGKAIDDKPLSFARLSEDSY